MAEIKNKFVSWTLNVIREIEPAKLYGVGVNLTIDAAAKSSAAASPTDSSTGSRVIVSEIHPSGPASKCLKSGDKVLAVNDTPIDAKATPQDVAKLVRGPEGSEVSVLVERNGKKLEFKLTRERIGQISNDGDGKAGAVTGSGRDVNKHQEELRLSECVEDVSKEIGKLSVEDLPVEYKKTQVPVAQNATTATSTHSKEQSQVQDLTSSNESSDKFTEQHLSSLPSLPTRKSFETHSEEKSHDGLDNCSAINSVDGEHWELLSAASGSAVVISFSGSISGSLRSASPSMLSNKFILSESTGDEYMEHVVLPTDTLQGLCLAYKLSATRLRMINGFSGNSLQMAPKKLRIPTPTKSSGIMIRTQDKSSKEYKLYAFCAELPSMELVEAKAYLDLSNWDLDEAIRSAKEDDGWNIRGDAGACDEGMCDEVCNGMIEAVARPKALTANDIYAAAPPFDGDGFELKDISS